MVSNPADAVSVCSRFQLLLLNLAQRHGVPRQELCRSVGLELALLEEEDGRTPARLERALWREATARSGDPLFGLHAIRLAPPRFLGLYESLCTTAATYREALELGVRYSDLSHSGLSLGVESDEQTLRLIPTFVEAAGEPDRQVQEYTLASLMIMAQACTGRRPRVHRVTFPHAAPERREHVRELEAHFGTRELEFGAERMSISFAGEILDWPGATPAPRLQRLLRGHADLLLGALPDNSSLLRRARRHLMDQLQEGHPSLGELAARMGLDRRTLQRRLEDHGSSFQTLLEELRRELSIRYLEEDLELAEVAFRLGYTSPQSFHRAFRAWTGTPPGRWRRERSRRPGASASPTGPS